MDKMCVHVAVRDQISIGGVVWPTTVHTIPTCKPSALYADFEATIGLVGAAAS